MAKSTSGELYELLTGDEEGRLCKDIPEAACHHQPRNFLIHAIALAATKTGDGLADPKLVLAWLLASIGAPASAIGLLVPVREALALLPQLFTSAQIRSAPVRKWIWAAGSAVQGLAVIGMAVAGLTMTGAAGGWTIVGLLALFATARSTCSVSYKDVLGKTISKQTRGTTTGTAGTIAATIVFAFGLSLSFGLIPLNLTAISMTLLIAGSMWILAAAIFILLREDAGSTEGGANGLSAAVKQFGHLRRDRQLVRFIAVRALLIATALAPPFILSMSNDEGAKMLAGLGPFVVASSLAAIASSYIWGRLADRSSRQVLFLAALGGALATGAAAFVGLLAPTMAKGAFVMPALLFLLMIAYQGVRLGRSTHIVDMADEDRRASYTALSNTIIGLLLLAGGVFGFVAEIAGSVTVLFIFAVMCLGAAVLANGLENVQKD